MTEIFRGVGRCKCGRMTNYGLTCSYCDDSFNLDDLDDDVQLESLDEIEKSIEEEAVREEEDA